MVKDASSGFTTIELVVTMIVISILAVAVVPRFAGTRSFDARGFHDETLSLLRYAQKSAIAQRRTVCVAFAANSVTLTIAANAGATVCNNNPLAGPNGASPYQALAETGVQYTTTPAALTFDALGRPSAASSIQVAGLSRTITVEAETGYVHE